MVVAVRVLTPAIPHRLPAQRAGLCVVRAASYVAHSVALLVVIVNTAVDVVDARLPLMYQSEPALPAVVELAGGRFTLKAELFQV